MQQHRLLVLDSQIGKGSAKILSVPLLVEGEEKEELHLKLFNDKSFRNSKPGFERVTSVVVNFQPDITLTITGVMQEGQAILNVMKVVDVKQIRRNVQAAIISNCIIYTLELQSTSGKKVMLDTANARMSQGAQMSQIQLKWDEACTEDLRKRRPFLPIPKRKKPGAVSAAAVAASSSKRQKVTSQSAAPVVASPPEVSPEVKAETNLCAKWSPFVGLATYLVRMTVGDPCQYFADHVEPGRVM